MAFAPYATLEEFREWVTLNDTIDDAVMNSVLTSVTQWTDEYTDRHFWRDGTVASPVARTFEACSRYELQIDDLVSVSSFKTDESGDGTFETTWLTSDYQLLPVNRPTGDPYTKARAVASRTFPMPSVNRRTNQVEITGVWGWTTVPESVHHACLLQASRLLKRRHSPEGVAGFGEFGAIRLSGRLDPDVQQMLDPYRRFVVLVA